MAERLVDKTVQVMVPPPRGNRIAYNDDVKGFGVRITAAGARAVILNYRSASREHRYTIGSFPEWSVTAAREEAMALKRRVNQGEDPMGNRHEKRAAPTVADLATLYIETHLPGSGREAAWQMNSTLLGSQ